MVTAEDRERSRTRMLPNWLWLAFIGAGLLYAVPSVWMLMAFIQQTYDLGIFDQTLWLIANGESFNTIAGYHVMGDHFSPVLYAISPLALLPGGAVPELVFHAMLIASGVFPAYKLARLLNRDPRWFVTVYAIHPAIVTGSWTGWRPWNLAVPFFMWACYLVTRHPTVMRIIVSGVVLLSFREDLAVWVGILAVVLYLAKRISFGDLVKSGVILGAATGVVVFVVLPAVSPVDGYFFAGDFTSNVPDAGEVIGSLTTRTLFLFLPLALAPSKYDWRLVAPLAIPIAGLLMRGGPSLTTFFQYDMMFVPLLMVVVGLSTHVDYQLPRLIAASLITLLAFGALRPIAPQHGSNPFLYDSQRAEDYRLALSDLEAIPDIESLSVTAPDTLVPHLSERVDVFIYPFPVDVIPDPDNIDSRLSFQCPPPDVIVERDDFLTASWISVIDEFGYQKLSTHGEISVWLAIDPIPDGPCSAQYTTRCPR